MAIPEGTDKKFETALNKALQRIEDKIIEKEGYVWPNDHAHYVSRQALKVDVVEKAVANVKETQDNDRKHSDEKNCRLVQTLSGEPDPAPTFKKTFKGCLRRIH
ncbi:hypothetical protein MPSEU_001086800 [Mayamaea pseudoterrestris]|nr:hypothetical protein MPSEU_001086800 [Mayamaea pseudoterrestris]